MRFEDNSLSIGRTPLVKLNRLVGHNRATVWAKIEGRNPSYSVKCRIGASMVWDAEKRGILGAAKELIEPRWAQNLKVRGPFGDFSRI